MKEIGIYRLDVGSCNGCDIEVLSTLASRFGLAKLGVKLVDEPSEASVLLITGVPTVKMREPLKQVYEKIRDPKLVVAVGACALAGEAFKGSYSVDGMTDEVIRVNVYVPGCPPRPQAIVSALARALRVKLEEPWPAPEGFRGKPELDSEKCTGCGACAQVCPAGAVDLIDKGDRRVVSFYYDKCIFCGLCEEACPEEAISLVPEYHLEVRDREMAATTTELELARCGSCGSFFDSPRQFKSAIERIIKQVEEYEEFRDLLRQWMETCPKCRGTLENIKRAKSLLLELTEVLKNSP